MKKQTLIIALSVAGALAGPVGVAPFVAAAIVAPAKAAATSKLGDLSALPGNRFESLKGKRKGQYSVRINDQWRICFEWPKGSLGPTNVEIVDYH